MYASGEKNRKSYFNYPPVNKKVNLLSLGSSYFVTLTCLQPAALSGEGLQRLPR